MLTAYENTKKYILETYGAQDIDDLPVEALKVLLKAVCYECDTTDDRASQHYGAACVEYKDLREALDYLETRQWRG